MTELITMDKWFQLSQTFNMFFSLFCSSFKLCHWLASHHSVISSYIHSGLFLTNLSWRSFFISITLHSIALLCFLHTTYHSLKLYSLFFHIFVVFFPLWEFKLPESVELIYLFHHYWPSQSESIWINEWLNLQNRITLCSKHSGMLWRIMSSLGKFLVWKERTMYIQRTI